MRKKYWFKAKRYGWGWYPATWQGWFIVGVFVLFLVWNSLRIDATAHSVSDTIRPVVIQTFLLTLVLLGVCYITGDPPKWRWGDKNGKNK